MSETTAEYKTGTDAFDELVTALNNLNQEIQNPASTIGKIDALLTTSSKASELVSEIDNVLKACNLCYLDPKVDRLRMLLERLRDVQEKTTK